MIYKLRPGPGHPRQATRAGFALQRPPLVPAMVDPPLNSPWKGTFRGVVPAMARGETGLKQATRVYQGHRMAQCVHRRVYFWGTTARSERQGAISVPNGGSRRSLGREANSLTEGMYGRFLWPPSTPRRYRAARSDKALFWAIGISRDTLFACAEGTVLFWSAESAILGRGCASGCSGPQQGSAGRWSGERGTATRGAPDPRCSRLDPGGGCREDILKAVEGLSLGRQERCD